MLSNAPLFAYISANRVGHQAWETVLHIAYSNKTKKKLVIVYSNSVANKSFGVLKDSRTKFVQLPSVFIFINNRISHYLLRFSSKTTFFVRRILNSLRGNLGFVFFNNLGVPRDSIETNGYFKKTEQTRYSNDLLGSVFDVIFGILPSLRSAPSNGLTISDDHGAGFLYKYYKALQAHSIEKGENILQLLGLTGTDWFVCLHVRESSFLGDTFREWQNQDIDRYLEAIKFITELGGYVIRMGNPSMKKMPIMPNVIDYAHSKYKSDFADIYISSKAKFAIVNNSGYRAIPQLFGVPLLTVNQYPISPMDIYNQSLIIYKKVYSRKLCRMLNFDEILRDVNLCHYDKDLQYLSAGIEIRENDENEILDAVIEILTLVDSKKWDKPSKNQQLFQSEIRRRLKSSQHVYGNGRTIFYPDLFCRIGTNYMQAHWPGFDGNCNFDCSGRS